MKFIGGKLTLFGINYSASKLPLLGVCFVLIFGFLFMDISSAKIDPKTVAAAWLFDEGAGDVARDSSKNRNHGKMMKGAKWDANGKFGKALSLDGKEAYVEVPSSPSLDITEQITLASWVKSEAFDIEGERWRRLLEKTNPAQDAAYMIYFEAAGQAKFAMNNPGDTFLRATSATPVLIGKWTHVAGSYDGETLRVYIDGVESGSHQSKGTIKSTKNPVGIGISKIPTSDGNFKGLLDEVTIVSAALSEDDIKSIMTKGLTEGLGLSVVASSEKLTTTWGSLREKY